jgi:hypothetical protein
VLQPFPLKKESRPEISVKVKCGRGSDFYLDGRNFG